MNGILSRRTGFVALLIILFYSLLLLAAEPYQGYTMFGSGSKAYLYDMDGKLAHTWSATGSRVQTTAYLLPDGSALFPLSTGSECPFSPSGAHKAGRIQIVSWDGEILWNFKFCDNSFCPSYDLEPLPNGNVLICAGLASNKNGPGKIFEVKPVGKDDGEVVWECDVNALMSGTRGYINCISYNPVLNQIMINIQTPGKTLAIIDRQTGKLVSKSTPKIRDRTHGGCWIMETFIGSDMKIPNVDLEKMRVGNLITVSNHDDEAVEVNPKTGAEVKRFSYNFGSHQGGVQRLPNGNTLVTAGSGRKVEELDENGKIVWTINTQAGVQRAYKYGNHYPGLKNLNPTGITHGLKDKEKLLSLIPNPQNKQLSLSLSGHDIPHRVGIYSAQGKLVLTKKLVQKELIINTALLTKGLYMVQVKLQSGAVLSDKVTLMH